ncbi:oxidoreductase [Nocardioides sp.]|uniref:oxidoreductase n=1 Tax=Nocardioides sp. TaxID=35761 RepID=UPI0035286047
MQTWRLAGGEVDSWAALQGLEGVGSGYAAARDGVDALLRDRGLRRSGPDTTVEALLLGAQASAALEGSSATVEDCRGGVVDDIAAASLRVSTELLALVPVLGRSPVQAFARLHALAAAGTLPEDRVGRPASPEAARALQALGAALLASDGLPALLVAAVTHAELATSGPFESHVGLVARAAERLVLVARGVDPASVLVPEAAHLALRPAYESNLRGWATGGAAGRHAWLLYAAEAFARAAELSPLTD